MKTNSNYLIAIAAIMLLNFGAKAQGGLTPLVDSTHNLTCCPSNDGSSSGELFSQIIHNPEKKLIPHC